MSELMDNMESAFQEASESIEADKAAASSEGSSLNTESEEYQQATDDSDIDVPSYLDTIGDGQDLEQVSSEEPTTEVEQSASQVEETIKDLIKYTAEGQEFEATPEQAAKALSLMKGARRAFSDRARLQREVKKLQDSSTTNDEFRKKWEHVMAGGTNLRQVFERLTGNPLDGLIDQEIQKRQLYAQATPDERKLLDYNDKFKTMENRMKDVESKSTQKLEQAEGRAHDARVKYLQGIMEPAFENHAKKFDGMDPRRANKLRSMLWRNSVADLKELKQHGHEPNRKLINKVVDENASALAFESDVAVQQEVRGEVDRRQEAAAATAQEASTRNYGGPEVSVGDLVSKNPLDIFNILKSK